MALLDLSRSPHGGRLRLLPENTTEPRITPRTVIYHSIVGSAESAYRMFRDFSNLESHFIVDLDGAVWQLVDTGRQADANYKANDFAVSVETADNGHPDTYPWTSAQLDSLVWLGLELARIHGIPRRRCPAWDEAGYGHHTMFGAPSQWTPVAKTCPGRARIAQFPGLLDRIRRGGLEDDMAEADIIAAVERVRGQLGRDLRSVVRVLTTGVADSTLINPAGDPTQGWIADATTLDELGERLDSQQRQIDALATAFQALAGKLGETPVELPRGLLAAEVTGGWLELAFSQTQPAPASAEGEPT